MNIILIIADDLGWFDVGFRNKEIHTPNIDFLANNFTIFDKFYAQPVCTATRASIYTGDYAFNHGFDGVIWPWSDFGMVKKNNLPNTLIKNNYKTYLVGKWHVGHSRKKYLPNNLGFEYHYGNHTGCLEHWNHTYHDVHDFFENGSPIYPEGHSTDLYANKAIEIIKNRSKKNPFFICLAFNAPHVPLQTHDHFVQKYNFDNHNRNLFSAMVTHMDYKIGEIINVLKKENIFEETIIWFTSDNGGWIGNDFGGNNGPLKDGKISFYEGGIRVVNIAKFPSEKKIINKTCHAIDIFPTICELLKIECPKVDGQSVFEKNEDRDLYHHYKKINDENFVGCIRNGKWKYIKYRKEELYNIEDDPFEKNNLFEKNKNEVKILKSKLKLAEKNYKECNIDWIKPNGYPDDFKFPKYWGPPIKNKNIKILEKSNSELSMAESLGVFDNR
jgi:arylsulfatase A-like enzyme